MTQLRFLPACLAAPAVLFLASMAHAIQAPEPLPGCGDGPACAHGFECTVVGSSGCAPAACAPDQTCPPPEPCDVTEEYGCTPAHCGADADCASDMVCHAWTESCPVTDCACAPGEKCDCGATTCDPKTVSMCTPRYVLPCQTAADCGAGFTCEEQQDCACAGSGGAEAPAPQKAAPVPPSSGGAPPDTDVAPVPNCQCQSAGLRCVVKDVQCATDAECQAGWLCENTNVSSPAPAQDCAGGDCGATPDPQPSVGHCRPPYYGSRDADDLGQPVAEGTPGTDNGGSTTGSAGSSNGGTVPPKDPNAANGDGEAHESSACQMGPANAERGALSMLVLLGALFGLKRRRSA